MKEHYYQVFISPEFGSRERETYEFIAEFASAELAGRYLMHMRKMRRYANKDIIVIKADSPLLAPNGFQDCVCLPSGEYVVINGETRD